MAWVVRDGGLVASMDAATWPLSGDGLYEVMRTFGGVPILWSRHWARLCAGALALDLALPDEHAVRTAVCAIAARLGDDTAIRLVVARLGRAGELGRRASWWVVGEALPPPADPISLSTDLSPMPDVPWMRHKTLSNLDRVLALGQARKRGADDALRIDGQGLIAETAVAGLLVRIGDLWVIPRSDAALPSITAILVGELTGIHAVAIPAKELRAVTAICTCSAVRGVVPVARLDGRALEVDAAWAASALDQYFHEMVGRWSNM